MKTIGVISDTHGRLTDKAIAALEGGYSPEHVICHVAVDADEGLPIMEPTPCDFIVHVGDVGNADMPAQWILDRLREIAPLVAVSGNCDDPDQYVLEGKPLPLYVVFEEGDIRFAVFHDPKDLRAAIKGGLTNPAYIVPEPRVQIHGHTHVYHVSKHQSGIVMICPGAVTNPQGGNPPTLAILKIEGPDKLLSVDIVTL